MEQLINSLPALLRAAGNAEEVTEAAALAVWNHVAGEGLRQHTAATTLQKQKLTVVVSDPLWQHQLESMSGQFLFRLNALLGQGTIRFIEFCVDPKTLQTCLEQGRRIQDIQDKQSASKPVPFELISAAASIQDPSLRRAFLGAASSCVRRREAIQQS